MGGYQSGHAHASLISPGPTGAMENSMFFSPQVKRNISIIAHEEAGSADVSPSRKDRAHLNMTLPPAGSSIASRNRKMRVSYGYRSSNSVAISPISHAPMQFQPGADNINAAADSRNGGSGDVGHVGSARASSVSIGGKQQTEVVDFVKTSLQARAEGHIKPKAYNAWDILALNETIKHKVDEHNKKMYQQRQQIAMRKFYDDQVHHKKLLQISENENDKQLGAHIKEKVQTINKLTDLDNTKRMLARGYVALENLTAANVAKQKRDIMNNKAKVETIQHLEENGKVNSFRAEVQEKIKE